MNRSKIYTLGLPLQLAKDLMLEQVVERTEAAVSTTCSFSPSPSPSSVVSPVAVTSRFCRVLALDAGASGGCVALVFTPGREADGHGVQGHVELRTQPPREYTTSVWLKDKHGIWLYLADSFGSYFRLAVMHLGIIGWPSVFHPGGIPPDTRAWLRYLCPERLAIDLDGRDLLLPC